MLKLKTLKRAAPKLPVIWTLSVDLKYSGEGGEVSIDSGGRGRRGPSSTCVSGYRGLVMSWPSRISLSGRYVVSERSNQVGFVL